MDDFARVLFQKEIIREQLSYNMYLELSKKAKTKTLKDLFLKLADEELIHKNLFSKIDLSILKIVNDASLKKLNLLNDVKEDELLLTNSIEEINNALDFAISEEQKAYDDYNLLINHLEFGEARETLKEIANQEKVHKTLLQKVKLDFNDNGWGVI